MPADLQMVRLALCAWPWLAARHAILDIVGFLLTNRCQVEKLLFYDRSQPLRQVADIWPLRPADNRPNPCGTQFPHLKAL